MDIYTKVLRALLRGGMTTADTMLAVCGGKADAGTLREQGFEHVTIANLDTTRTDYAYPWTLADAEALPFANGSYDWCIVHAGLHHCRSPHLALLEMCRVARKGAIVIEARDSLLIRLAVRMGLVEEYERTAVASEGYTAGGMRNGPVPNFVYRWTERDARKTVESAFPHRVNDIRFFYDVRTPRAHPVLGMLAKILHRVFPRQCNSFAFVVRDGGDKPWITRATGEPTMRRDPHVS